MSGILYLAHLEPRADFAKATVRSGQGKSHLIIILPSPPALAALVGHGIQLKASSSTGLCCLADGKRLCR